MQERLPRELGQLYRTSGYVPYTMSKFEEYELYLRNKDFLISDRVLTFTDTDGKLMALKPDVTLSIIKNARQRDMAIQKLYYRETVYRPGRSMQGFREIMQIGLECMGQVDSYCVLEVLTLAVKSLRIISKDCILDISHMGLLEEALEKSKLQGTARTQALAAIESKNLHALRAIGEEQQTDVGDLVILADLYGAPDKTLPVLEKLFPGNRDLMQMKQILDALKAAGCGDCINLDFSVVNSRKYYNGIVFRGFVQGVPESVLSGGQYDGLMARMDRKEKAIGFALYPDLLDRLESGEDAPLPDAFLLYPVDASLHAVSNGVAVLTAKGLRVCAQPDMGKRPVGNCFILKGNEVTPLETDA